MRKKWWIVILILALAKFWNAYQKQQAIERINQAPVSSFILKTDLYVDTLPTGDTMYWTVKGVNADAVVDVMLEELNFTGDSYAIRTIKSREVNIIEPMICSFAVEGVNIQLFSYNREWGESTCETMLERAD